MEKGNINSRIKEVIDIVYKGNAVTLSEAADISPSTISSIVGKRQNAPSFIILSKIYEDANKYGVSAHWLLTGEGDMIDDNAINKLFSWFNDRGKLSPEAKDNYIKHLEEKKKELEEEIKELKEDIKMKDTTISKRDELINTLFGEMAKLVKGEK